MAVALTKLRFVRFHGASKDVVLVVTFRLDPCVRPVSRAGEAPTVVAAESGVSAASK